MGLLTLTEMIEEVRYNLGNRTDVSDISIARYLNFIQDSICRQHTFPELKTTLTTPFTIHGEYLTLATQPRAINSIRLIDGIQSFKVTSIPESQWDTLHPYPLGDSEGKPEHYLLLLKSIYWWPIPDAAYARIIKYSKWPTPLTGSAVSEYDNKDDILVALGTGWAFKRLGDLERMNQWATGGWNQLLPAIQASTDKPDTEIVPVSEIGSMLGQYWADPFNRGR